MQPARGLAQRCSLAARRPALPSVSLTWARRRSPVPAARVVRRPSPCLRLYTLTTAHPSCAVTTASLAFSSAPGTSPSGGGSGGAAASPAAPAMDAEERAFRSTLGHSDEDAFGQSDPLGAVTTAARAAKGGEAPPTGLTGSAAADDVDEAIDTSNPNKAAEQLRRRGRRRKSFDDILGDVLHDALRLRDQGEKPTVDFMHKRTQERMYEDEYGHKPPSAKDHAAKYIPFPPDFSLHRLIRLYPRDGYDAETGAASRTNNWPTDDRNGLDAYCLFPEADPWPERTITPENPVWTRRDLDDDRARTGGQGYADLERRLYAPRDGYDVSGEFLDAMDELAYWEATLLDFLRRVPLSQRRSLPYLHEFHRLFVHRTIRAEKRYIATRDAAMSQVSISPSVFKRTEEPVERVRDIYAEAHRSLSSPNYDPLRMKKSKLAPFMRMSDAEFTEWKEVQKQRRNALLSELS